MSTTQTENNVRIRKQAIAKKRVYYGLSAISGLVSGLAAQAASRHSANNTQLAVEDASTPSNDADNRFTSYALAGGSACSAVLSAYFLAKAQRTEDDFNMHCCKDEIARVVVSEQPPLMVERKVERRVMINPSYTYHPYQAHFYSGTEEDLDGGGGYSGSPGVRSCYLGYKDDNATAYPHTAAGGVYNAASGWINGVPCITVKVMHDHKVGEYAYLDDVYRKPAAVEVVNAERWLAFYTPIARIMKLNAADWIEAFDEQSHTGPFGRMKRAHNRMISDLKQDAYTNAVNLPNATPFWPVTWILYRHFDVDNKQFHVQVRPVQFVDPFVKYISDNTEEAFAMFKSVLTAMKDNTIEQNKQMIKSHVHEMIIDDYNNKLGHWGPDAYALDLPEVKPLAVREAP